MDLSNCLPTILDLGTVCSAKSFLYYFSINQGSASQMPPLALWKELWGSHAFKKNIVSEIVMLSANLLVLIVMNGNKEAPLDLLIQDKFLELVKNLTAVHVELMSLLALKILISASNMFARCKSPGPVF